MIVNSMDSFIRLKKHSYEEENQGVYGWMELIQSPYICLRFFVIVDVARALMQAVRVTKLHCLHVTPY